MKSLFFTLTLACLLSACTYHKPSHYDYFSKKQLNVDTAKLETPSEGLSQALNTSSSDQYVVHQSYHSATGHLCKIVSLKDRLRTACFIEENWYLFPEVTQ